MRSTNPTNTALDLFFIPGLQSRMYSLEEIREAFDAMDFDKNGCLDDSDIRNVLLLTGEKATEEELHEMIRMIDHDGTGIVSFDEFARLFLYPDQVFVNTELIAHTASGIPDAQGSLSFTQLSGDSEASRAMRLEIKKEISRTGLLSFDELKNIFGRFRKVDKENTGRLGYLGFLNALGKTDSAGMQRVFKIFDVDGSGEIDLWEFVMGLNAIADSSLKQKISFGFKLFDTDDSGYIDRPELVRILKANLRTTDLETKNKKDIEAMIERKADSLYDALSVPRGSPLSEDKFAELVGIAPELVLPSVNELAEGLHSKAVQRRGSMQ